VELIAGSSTLQVPAKQYLVLYYRYSEFCGRWRSMFAAGGVHWREFPSSCRADRQARQNSQLHLPDLKAELDDVVTAMRTGSTLSSLCGSILF